MQIFPPKTVLPRICFHSMHVYSNKWWWEIRFHKPYWVVECITKLENVFMVPLTEDKKLSFFNKEINVSYRIGCVMPQHALLRTKNTVTYVFFYILHNCYDLNVFFVKFSVTCNCKWEWFSIIIFTVKKVTTVGNGTISYLPALSRT